MKDFDLAGLSEALDARRRELGLTWQEGRRETSEHPLPDDDTGRPALDTRAIYLAVNDRRARQGLTWREVADEIGPGFSPGMLTRLAGGTRIGFPRVMRIFRWLGRPVAEFTCFVPDVDE